MSAVTARAGSRVGRPLRSLLAALACASVLVPSVAPAAAAADVVFGTPAASVSYGESIEFSVPVTAGEAIDRMELHLTFPDALGPYIVEVTPPAGAGTQTARYTLDLTGDGHLVPNTTIVEQWVAITGAGVQASSTEHSVLYADTTHDWRSVKGDLMTVHWYDGDPSFAQRALAIGEKAIHDTSALLGVTESDPVDFFIYGDDASFRAALGPGTRENVGGQAHADIRTLFALISPDAINDPWVGVVVPHELVHLVFDTAVRNPYRFPPRWLNEGLAVYLSEGYTPSDEARVSSAVRSKDLIPLDALGGQFPTDADKTYLAYAESASAIDYLVRTKGSDTLYGLVLGYRDGLTDDEAFTRALGTDLAGFQAGWLSELGAAPPVRYGPQPAPAGPLPAEWGGSGQTPAAGAPSAAATPAAGPSSPASGGGDAGQLYLAVGAIVLAVGIGLALARRRSRVG